MLILEFHVVIRSTSTNSENIFADSKLAYVSSPDSIRFCINAEERELVKYRENELTQHAFQVDILVNPREMQDPVIK